MATLLRTTAQRIKDPALRGRWFAFMPNTFGSEPTLVEAATPTFPKIAPRPRIVSGRNRFYPDVVDIDQISLTLYESDSFQSSRYMAEWHKLVYDYEDGTYGLPVNYWRDIRIEFYPVDSDAASQVLTYRKCWPTDRQSLELGYDQIDGRLTCTLQLAVDSVEQQFRS